MVAKLILTEVNKQYFYQFLCFSIDLILASGSLTTFSQKQIVSSVDFNNSLYSHESCIQQTNLNLLYENIFKGFQSLKKKNKTSARKRNLKHLHD